MNPESVMYQTILTNIRNYPAGTPSAIQTPYQDIQKAVNRGVHAITIGLLDLKNVSERYTTNNNFPMRQLDYENALTRGLRGWWGKKVLQEALKLLEIYIKRDMEIMTGM